MGKSHLLSSFVPSIIDEANPEHRGLGGLEANVIYESLKSKQTLTYKVNSK